MADKTKELEERIDRLESRVKTTFLEIERRFEQLKAEQPMQISVEDRIQEIEDLILLMQLEITKMREKGQEGAEFIVAAKPDIEERLHKLEEVVANAEHMHAADIHEGVQRAPAGPQADYKDIKYELEKIEKRLEQLEQRRAIPSSTILEDVRKILNY